MPSARAKSVPSACEVSRLREEPTTATLVNQQNPSLYSRYLSCYLQMRVILCCNQGKFFFFFWQQIETIIENHN